MNPEIPAGAAAAIKAEGLFECLVMTVYQAPNGVTVETTAWRHHFPDGSTVSGRTIRRYNPVPQAMIFTGFDTKH